MTPPPVIGASLLGINFDADGTASLSSTGFPTFQDRIREARGFTDVATITNPIAITNGWPTVDFSCLLGESPNVQPWTVGTFKCGYTGTGAETISGISATISNIVNIGGVVTFDLLPGSSNYGFKITGTTAGVVNLFAYIPGYGTSTIAAGRYTYSSVTLLTAEAIAHYKKYRYIRWMDYSNARFNTASMTAANRNTAANQKTNKFGATTNTGDGYNLNWAVDACKQFGIGCYYTVALNYDPTYLPAVASDLAAMTPGYTNYVEPGNELWNFGGGIGGVTYQNKVAAYKAAHPGVIDYDSTTDQNTLNGRYLAIWLHDIYTAMSGAFGARYGTDLKIVAMWQTGGGGLATLNECAKFLIHQYGSVKPFVHAMGMAPYMTRDNTHVPADGVNHSGSNDAVGSMQTQLANNAAYLSWLYTFENVAVLAMHYGLQVITYEGGQEVGGDLGLSNMGAAIMDAGMTPVCSTYLNNVMNSGCNLFTWLAAGVFTNTNASSPEYNLSNNLTTLLSSGSPRLAGFANLLAGNITYTRNLVSGSGSSFNGKHCADYANNNGTLTYLNPPLPTLAGQASLFAPYPGVTGYVPYIVNCTVPGTYSVGVNFTVTSPTGTEQTNLEYGNALDGFTIAATNVSIPAGTNTVTLGNVVLRAGPNYVLLGKGTFQINVTINSLTFT